LTNLPTSSGLPNQAWMTRNNNPSLPAGRLAWLARLLLIGLLAGTACDHAPAASPPPTQQVIHVALPASLEPLEAGLQGCAADQPGIALFIENPNSPSTSAADLAISLGETSDPPAYAASLAVEDLVVVLNQSNRLDALAGDSLRSLYTGQITRWDGLSSASGAVQVWDYAVSDPLHQSFNKAVLKGSPVTSLAYIAPSPAAMLEALSANPQAVGYLPRAWLTESKVYAVNLAEDTKTALHLPVLALAPQEPQGVLRNFLACLQTGKGHTVIMQRYQPAKP
jgi:hypothetical protein